MRLMATILTVAAALGLAGSAHAATTTRTHQPFQKGKGGLQLTVMGAAAGNEVWLLKAGVTTIARSSVPLYFSTSASTGSVLDDLALYDEALTPAVVAAHQQAGL